MALILSLPHAAAVRSSATSCGASTISPVMLNFFKPRAFQSPELGEFTRSRGHWRGRLTLGGSAVPLVLVGGRSQPDPVALQLAATVLPNFAAWRAIIAEALFQHFQPYAEALAASEEPQPGTPPPRIIAAADVWAYTVLAFVSVMPIDRVLTIEFGFTTVWDEEHTLGVRFQDGKLLELNGSVLPP